MELGYEPICAGVRQRYLFSVAFRMLALAAPLADYFAQYRADGVTSNVVLQCAMIAMLSVHLAMFFALICFNRRQNLLLRVLSGVTGVFPALTASAAVSAGCANIAQQSALRSRRCAGGRHGCGVSGRPAHRVGRAGRHSIEI